MWRHAHFHIGLVILIALAAFFFVRMRPAGGTTEAETSISEGHRIAKEWCESCHVIEPHMTALPGPAPSFEAVANQPGTTAMALKVFFRTSHHDMPNIVITPDQAEALVSYFFSLKSR